MNTNAPKPVTITVSNSSPSFVVSGMQGFYAKVTIRLSYSGSSDLAVTDPKTSETLDSLTATSWGLLVYIVDNLKDDRYNVVSSTVGTWSGKAIIEYHRTTFQERI